MIRRDTTKGSPEPVRALDRIVERESGEPLVHLAEASPSAVILRPTVIPYLRESVARMLESACLALPAGYRLGVIDAWRPLIRQRRIYEWMTSCVLEVWPDLPHAAVRRRVNRFVAPWNRKAPPGHCTGGAVDVFLVGPDGEQVDVSAPFGRFRAAATYTLGLDRDALRHREMMIEAMLGAGFSNCRDEFWHYSFGDAGWAVRAGLRDCPYGIVELDPALYAEQERLWIEALAERPNPFLEGS
ncbi:MAG TPA: M15 family metallopeptidase [Fimbriimonadaceae bacterium]|nr:M15 family metallopeptidase [Fimbriimonadaceae bacterium]HRJ97570.1 M15 family metallopeptidase [Fimbriimonadaceae bacterium]